MAGAKGFEPSTSWSRTRRASQAALRPDGATQSQIFRAERELYISTPRAPLLGTSCAWRWRVLTMVTQARPSNPCPCPDSISRQKTPGSDALPVVFHCGAITLEGELGGELQD